MNTRFLLASILASSVSYADVLHVASDGSGDYLQIQAAVDAAADGDTILVEPTGGWYESFTIDDKDLRIVSAVLGAHAQARGTRVIDLSPGKQVLLGRLRLMPSQLLGLQFPGLELDQCAGSVRVDECLLSGGLRSHGAFITACADVSLVDCIVEGGDGSDVLDFTVDGAHGVYALSSQVAITGCTTRGGDGVEYWSGGGGSVYGDGGDGVWLEGGFAYVSASECAGGTGPVGGGNLGRAVYSTGDAQLHDNLYQGLVVGSTRSVPGKARVLVGPVFEADGVSTIRVSGKPGDRVVLFWATAPSFHYLRRQRGVLLSTPPFGLADEGWVVDASGELEFTWTPPATPPGEGRVLHLQARIDRGGAMPRLTNVASMLVVDWP